MKVKITISNEDGEVLDTEDFDADCQHYSLLENTTGFNHPHSILELNIGKIKGKE